MPQADEQVVQSCLNGHPEAYRQLVERYQSPLSGCLHARLGNAEEAAEAAQETFVRAYFALSQLRKPASFFSWLLGIADRVAKESRRSAARRRNVDWGPDEPTDRTDKRDTETDEALTRAVAGLPETYREVVVLRFHGGKSCAEIGRDLGVPLGTVTKRLSRAYALLRETLGPTFLGGESETLR
jgi:RNA polymerase sigma-70 factor, ECF subfamily